MRQRRQPARERHRHDPEALGAHLVQQRALGADADHLVAARPDRAHQRQQEVPEREIDVGDLDDLHRRGTGDRLTVSPAVATDLADRPFHLLRAVGVAGQHHLLAAARLGAAEVDALLQAHAGAVGAQPPAAAGAQPQQHRLAVLLQAGIHVRMQMEAQREGLRGRRLHRVLAAHVLAALGQIEPAPVHRAEQLLPAVMAGLQPVRAVGLLALRLHHRRPPAEPVRLQLRRADIGDHQRGMRGRRAGRVAPFRAARRERRRSSRSCRSRPTDSSIDSVPAWA